MFFKQVETEGLGGPPSKYNFQAALSRAFREHLRKLTKLIYNMRGFNEEILLFRCSHVLINSNMYNEILIIITQKMEIVLNTQFKG